MQDNFYYIALVFQLQLSLLLWHLCILETGGVNYNKYALNPKVGIFFILFLCLCEGFLRLFKNLWLLYIFGRKKSQLSNKNTEKEKKMPKRVKTEKIS